MSLSSIVRDREKLVIVQLRWSSLSLIDGSSSCWWDLLGRILKICLLGIGLIDFSSFWIGKPNFLDCPR